MNELAITIFILIIPGILCLSIILNLITHPKIDSFYFIVYSILLGIGAYLLLQIFYWSYDEVRQMIKKTYSLHHTLAVWSIMKNSTSTCINPKEIIFATVLSIPLAFLGSYIINCKIITLVAKKLNVSSKYGDENLYYYYLNATELDWVYIRNIDRNLTYQGRVKSFSESDKSLEIVLTDVSIYTYVNSEYIYSVPSMYLSFDHSNVQIEQISNTQFSINSEGVENGKESIK